MKASDDHFWDYMNTEVLPQVRSGIEGKEWSEIPGIKGSRAAYKAFGRNPGRYRVSSESLIRRVRRGDDLYHINSVVDVNNLISVRSGLSVGSYDLGQVHGANQELAGRDRPETVEKIYTDLKKWLEEGIR